MQAFNEANSGNSPMATGRSTVEHHPLVNQDTDEFGHPTTGSGRVSPETGYIMDTDLTGLGTQFQEPPDPSLSLLEVPNTNWTRPVSSASTGSGGSTSAMVTGGHVSINITLF